MDGKENNWSSADITILFNSNQLSDRVDKLDERNWLEISDFNCVKANINIIWDKRVIIDDIGHLSLAARFVMSFT